MVGRAGRKVAAEAAGKSLFDRARAFFQPAARALDIDEMRPLDMPLERLAKPTDRDEELLRAGYGEVQNILKKAHGRPSLDELRQIVKHTNPTKVDGFSDNCSACAMAVDDILRGRPAVAEKVADPPNLDGLLHMARSRIIGADGMAAGKSGRYDIIESFLLDKGPGTRGIVHALTTPERGGGVHAGNAVNIDGKAYYVDGQVGIVEDFTQAADKYFEFCTFFQTR